ncbi:unnamed protein product [Camellia sinensis]
MCQYKKVFLNQCRRYIVMASIQGKEDRVEEAAVRVAVSEPSSSDANRERRRTYYQERAKMEEESATYTREGKEVAKEKTSSVANTAAKKARECKDLALGKAIQYKDYAAEKVREANDSTLEKAGEYKDYAIAEKAKETKAVTMEKAREGKDSAIGKISELKELAVDAAKRAKDLLSVKSKEEAMISTMECGSFELHQSLTGNGHTLTDNPHNFSLSKPWPILPSYLPWPLNPNVPFRSCESYFGNGFTRRIDLLKSSLSHHRTGGWFRCFYSEMLRSSICEGGRVRMHPDKIRMSIGGERLEAVMGRGEDEELPVFESGAFDVEVVDRSSHGRKLVDDEFLNQYVQFGADSLHTMRGLVDSVKLVGASDLQCSE